MKTLPKSIKIALYIQFTLLTLLILSSVTTILLCTIELKSGTFIYGLQEGFLESAYLSSGTSNGAEYLGYMTFGVLIALGLSLYSLAMIKSRSYKGSMITLVLICLYAFYQSNFLWQLCSAIQIALINSPSAHIYFSKNRADSNIVTAPSSVHDQENCSSSETYKDQSEEYKVLKQ